MRPGTATRAHSDVPIADLLSAEYAAERRRLVTDRASADLVPGSPGGRQPGLPGYAMAGGSVAALASGTGEPTLGAVSLGPGDTCHLDIADRFGNLVSATPSGGWLQSSPVVPGLGFCLGTRGQMFALTPGFASTLAPGQAAADHPVAQPGPARRRAVYGIRDSRR